MKRYIQFLTLVLAAAAISACTVKETATETANGREIKFQAGIGSFQAKATDTAFEKGDAIGLFADAPVSAANVRLTADGESLIPESPLYWGLEQDVNQPVAFYAYYPYAAGTAAQFSFAVAADQTSAAALAAADLMLASTAAAPSDASVRLNFGHRMSRAVIVVRNNVNNSAVTGVTVSGVALEADVDITVPSISAKGQPSTVKAAPVTGADGSGAWAVILPPQRPQALIITVTLADGSSYDIPVPGAVLEEGYSYNVTATIDATMSDVEFSAGITDWLEVSISIGQNDDPGVQSHEWAILVDGTFYPMTLEEDGLWHVSVFVGTSLVCQVARDEGDQLWGSAVPATGYYLNPDTAEAVEIPLAPDTYLSFYSYSSLCELSLDASAKKLYAKAKEPDWEFAGTGKFIDGFVSDVFGLPHEEFDVDIYTEEHAPNIYRIMNPYRNWRWKDLFNYEEGAYLDLVIKEDGTAYFKDSQLGLSHSSYGLFYGISPVPENGWPDYDYYGNFYPEYGYVEFSSASALWLTDYGTVLSNRAGMMGVTLPGGRRPVRYSSLSHVYDSNRIDDSGTHYFTSIINVGMDVAKVRYGLYSGALSVEEVYGSNNDGVFYTDVMTDGTEIDIIPDYDNYVEFAVPGTGTYTLVLYYEDIDGRWSGNYGHYWILFDGDDVPETSISVTASPAQPLSDIQAIAHVDFQDPAELYIMVVQEDAWTSWGIPDGNVYDYVLSNGESKNIYYINSQAGADYKIPSLMPETSYRVLVAGSNKFGMPGWAQATVTTTPEPSFTSLGTGHYADNFLEIEKAEVEILKADTEMERYRVIAPYHEFWEENAGEAYYSGFHAAKIDCYVDGDQFVYEPYYIGYHVEDFGDVRYYSYNPFSGAHLANNTILQEGVFNIAPYAKIEGTNYYFNLISEVGTIYLELPGYTYNPAPAPAGAPKRSLESGRSNLVEAPASSGVMVQTEKRPFTRHMLGTNARVVEKANSFQITAEPLKK